MTASDIIIKKRDGRVLSDEEISFFLSGYLKGVITDYQMSAFLMALFFYTMTDSERSTFTSVMLQSGNTLSFPEIPLPKIDKHSTGGVGDGTSISLAPLVAACGLAVPMMSGRGLGHTGGTLDKLESIPGFKVQLPQEKIRQILGKTGLCLFGQSADLVPLDRKLYALRDVTGTVENIDLISASIMSKKLAEGIDGLVLDVKTGRGAFMKELSAAERLATTMCAIGKAAGKSVTALITDMNEPLGSSVGNALEMVEQIELLKGRGQPDMLELVLALGSEMLLLGKSVTSAEEAQRKMLHALSSGSALEKLREIVIEQGGDPEVLENYDRFPQAKFTQEIKSEKEGYIAGLDPLAIGKSAILLGAGRMVTTDEVDPSAGFKLLRKKGDKIAQGDIIALAYANDRDKLAQGTSGFRKAVEFSDQKPNRNTLIIKRISG